jgi:hypothetical protein
MPECSLGSSIPLDISMRQQITQFYIISLALNAALDFVIYICTGDY